MEISKKLTSKESFAILHEIESRKYPGGIKFSDWQEQKEKAKLDAIKNLVPEVGLGCTVCYYSDKRAATVTKIISPCKIEVTFNQTKCIDYYASEYEVLPELESLAKKHQNHRKIGDEYTCLLIEYRLTDINFHTEASLLHAGEYEKVIEIIKTW